jgi:hypothetical protein
MIVGLDYAARRYSVASSDGLVGQYSYAAGVSSVWPSLGASETVDLTTVTVDTIDALANYYADVDPTPDASEGVQSGTTPNAIIHNGGVTIFAGPNFTPALGNAVEVGDYVKLDDMSGNTLETKVADFGYTLGEPNILILEDNLPAALTGGAFFNVILAEIVPEYTIPAADLTLSASTVTADPGIKIATSRTGSAVNMIDGLTFGGDQFSLVYTSYRALRTASSATTAVLSITTETDLDNYFVGWEYPESGLGFAVRRAFSPTPTTGSRPAIKCIAPISDSTSDWQTAINLITRRSDWYAIVPLSMNSTIQSLFRSLIIARRAIGLHSELFISLDLTEETILLSGAGNTALVDQSQTPGFDRTVTRTGGVTAPFFSVQTGDIIRLGSADYIIDTKVSNQIVTLKSSAAPGAAAITNIRHPLTTAEQSVDIGARAQALDDSEVTVVFPPEPAWDSEVIDGYMLAAASAGMRGYTMPHQPLLGVQLEDGWSVDQASFEFGGYLDALASYGMFVYDQCESVTAPNAVVYKANTTDQSETIKAREGLVANEDSIRRYLTQSLSSYTGRVRVVSELLGELYVATKGYITYLKNSTNVSTFGSILVSGTVGRPEVSSTSEDIVEIPIDIEIAPFLEDVQMVITISLTGG